MDDIIHATILAADIVEELRPERHVIERGVEDALVGRGLRLRRECCESCCRQAALRLFLAYWSKSQSGSSALRLLRCSFGTDAGDTGLDENDFVSVWS